MTELTAAEIERIRDALRKLEASPVFAHAQRMLRFLRYIIEATVEGHGARLSQTAIAIDVFDREDNFDPAVDAVVRVEAGRLRAKLREYYDTEGSDDAVKIILPKGTYTPEIVAPASSGESPDAYAADVTWSASRPAIAVLPIADLGAPPADQSFADGLTEDITTGLSAYRWCSVMARHSLFDYRTRDIDLKDVARKLGSRYVVDGSVRAAGGRIRVNVQFSDAEHDVLLWAERFDRRLDDVFAVQDELTSSIVASIALELREAEIDRSLNKEPEDLTAWEAMNRGLWHLTRRNRIHNRLARRYLERSRQLDTRSAAPYAHLAVSHLLDWTHRWSDDANASLEQALATAREGVALDPQHSESQAALSACLKDMHRHAESIEAARRAVALNPFTYHSHHTLGSILSFAGQPRESLGAFQTALQLNPKGFDLDIILSSMGLNHLLLKDFPNAIQFERQSINTNGKLDRSYYRLAAALAHSGDRAGASAVLMESQKLVRGPSRSYLEILHPFARPEDFEYLLDGLRLAGWQDAA